MKSGTFKILQGALALSLVLSLWFSYKFIMSTREARKLTREVAMANMYRSTIQALAVDCVEYSKKNPAIDPVLKSVGLKQ